MSDGAILSRASFKSCKTPDSYSIVVIDPVEPGQKIVTSPLAINDCLTMESTWGVISIISLKPFVLSEIVSVIIINSTFGFNHLCLNPFHFFQQFFFTDNAFLVQKINKCFRLNNFGHQQFFRADKFFFGIKFIAHLLYLPS